MSVVSGIKGMWRIAKHLGKQPMGAHVYEGASNNRAMKNWGAPQTGPNVGSLSHATLVNRSRDIARNDPWGATMAERKVTNIVGTGIKPRSMASDRNAREAIQQLWNRWVSESDFDGALNFYGQQELVAREWYEAGECFARKRILRLTDDVVVPLRVQLIEAEQVPVNQNTLESNGNVVRSGIERDKNNQKTAYHMYLTHPGEMGFHNMGAGQLVRVPADEVAHIYQPLRAGQQRGLPTITPILSKLYQVTQFDDATLMRQWVSTLFAGVLKRPAGAGQSNINPLTGQVGEKDEDDFDLAAVEAGTVQELPAGWEMDWNKPPEAGTTYESFMRSQLMSAAAAIGMSYPILTGDLRGINDRLLRALLQEFRRRIRMSQHLIIAHQFCRDIWETWMDLAVLSGRLNLPDYEENRADYIAVRWVPERWQYLHPQQDIAADKDEVRSGFTTRAEKVAERGGDIEEIDAENQRAQNRTDNLGLVYDTDARRTSGAGVTQARPDGTTFPEPEEEDASDAGSQ